MGALIESCRWCGLDIGLYDEMEGEPQWYHTRVSQTGAWTKYRACRMNGPLAEPTPIKLELRSF